MRSNVNQTEYHAVGMKILQWGMKHENMAEYSQKNGR